MKILLLFLLSLNLFAQSIISNPGGYFFNDDGTYFIVKPNPGSIHSPTLNKTSFHGAIFSEDVIVRKTNYFIANFQGNEELFTIDNLGFVYLIKDYLSNIKGKIKHYGSNFFITNKGEFHYLNAKGLVGAYDKKKEKILNFKKVLKVMGRSFIVKGFDKKDHFITVSHEGFYFDKSEQFKHSYKDIKRFGDNYLQMNDGTLYTHGNIIDMNAGNYMVLYHFTELEYSFTDFNGGNYFFDNKNSLHTIAFDGSIDAHGFYPYAVNLYKEVDGQWEISTKLEDKTPQTLGSNYFVLDEYLFMVDSFGYYQFIEKMDSRISVSN